MASACSRTAPTASSSGGDVALEGLLVDLDQAPRDLDEVGLGIEVEHARHLERGVLATAVSHDDVRPDRQAVEHAQQREVGGPHRFDGPFDPPELLTRPLPLVPGKRRPGEDVVAREVFAGEPREDAVDAVEGVADLGEVQAEVGEHVRVLRAPRRG